MLKRRFGWRRKGQEKKAGSALEARPRLQYSGWQSGVAAVASAIPATVATTVTPAGVVIPSTATCVRTTAISSGCVSITTSSIAASGVHVAGSGGVSPTPEVRVRAVEARVRATTEVGVRRVEVRISGAPEVRIRGVEVRVRVIWSARRIDFPIRRAG